MVDPRAVHIHHDPGVGVAFDVVELHSRAGTAELRECAACRGQIGLETHLLADPEKLLLRLQKLENS